MSKSKKDSSTHSSTDSSTGSSGPSGPAEIKGIKSSVFSRGLSLAKLSLGAGTQLAGRSVSRLWESQETRDDKWKLFFTAQAKAFTKEVGELKGSLMKAGQMLSMYGEHFFPPEVNQFLKSLQHDSPPVQWEAVHKILVKELGPEKLARLEIEPKAVASASLGQVHRTSVKDTGDKLALKIQYPGVEKAIDSDLKAMKSFLSLINILPKGLDLTPVFDEVRTMLYQETDYLQEADWTEDYGRRLAGDERFVVPRVHRDFSNGHVLATSFEPGLRPDDPLVQSLSQERRDRLALNFLDLYFRELFDWRLVQTDPHSGNYRVRLRPDGGDQWVLLDFGATRAYPDDFIAAYRRMIRASLDDDGAAFQAAAKRLKLLADTDDPELVRLFQEFCFMLVEPFKGETYDWRDTDLPQRTTQMGFRILRGFPLRTPPREIVFLDRKTSGVFVMMGLLRARVSGREVLLKHLEEK